MEDIIFDKVLKNFFKNKKILITGHTGFVGSWITYYFYKLGCKITGVSTREANVNNIFSILKIKSKIKHYNFDICEKNKFKIFKNKKFDFVIHLAAKPLVFEGVNEPDIYIKNNILSSLNVFSQIKNASVIINFTTDKVYKNKNKINYKYKETDELGGDDPYSYSKTCSDLLTKTWASLNSNKKTHYCNVRSGNIIGGGDWNKKRIISDIVKLIFENKKLIVRSRYSTRPWVHIIEVCICLSNLIMKLKKNKQNYSDWNIGPNKKDEKNISWIINRCLIISNSKYLIKNVYFMKRKEFNEKNYLRLDNSKIRKKIKYDFNLNINQRLKLTLDWYNCYFNDPKNLENIIVKQFNYAINKSK